MDGKANIHEQFVSILDTISGFKSNITMLQNQVRVLEKVVKKQIKTYQKEAAKNRIKGNKKPSGFAVPMKISDKLCDFMKKPKGTEIARTEVTKYIIKYITDHNLQWKENKRIIKPDIKLKNLLDLKKNEEVTYFNLQRYMNKHFIKRNKEKNENVKLM
ncbi:MAG: hypothetical protein CMF69_04690 [Magnetovibrio sp.]|nr:hypothetical protein [Magnetovibrio sp.]|tara:strand:- start:1729 stop:2205 length:477 start_codon:yes stop_codon:yes gene_type:complete